MEAASNHTAASGRPVHTVHEVDKEQGANLVYYTTQNGHMDCSDELDY